MSPGPVLSERMKATALGSAESKRDDRQMWGGVRYRALRQGSWKIVESSEGEFWLYDLASDPSERSNLANEHPTELARMKAELSVARIDLDLPELDADLAAAEMPELDAATQDRLRELGYIE